MFGVLGGSAQRFASWRRGTAAPKSRGRVIRNFGQKWAPKAHFCDKPDIRLVWPDRLGHWSESGRASERRKDRETVRRLWHSCLRCSIFPKAGAVSVGPPELYLGTCGCQHVAQRLSAGRHKTSARRLLPTHKGGGGGRVDVGAFESAGSPASLRRADRTMSDRRRHVVGHRTSARGCGSYESTSGLD